MLWLLGQLNHFCVGALVLFGHAADLFHVLALLLVLHQFSLLAFLATDGLLLLK